MMRRIFTLSICIVIVLYMGASAFAQDFKPSISTALWHEKIDKAQLAILAADGKADDQIHANNNEEFNQQLTYLATTKVNDLQKNIELDNNLSTNTKLGYLRGISDYLNTFVSKLKAKSTKWAELPQWLNAYNDAVELDRNNEDILPIIQANPYAVGDAIAYNIAFNKQTNLTAIQETIFLKYIEANPYQVLKKLSERPNMPFTDSLIIAAAHRQPEELITYAQARGTVLANKIAANQDPLVKEIVAMSRDKNGQLYFPFLDGLYAGEITRQQISEAIKDEEDYYKLLVATEVKNAALQQKGQQAVAAKPLYNMLKQKSMEVYVNVINGLHDLGETVRFKKIQQLNAEELYYLIVCNETEIYTSSYMYVYKRIFEVLPVKTADTLLQIVHYDKYKKFLTMSSNYNTLDNFLGRMSKEHAQNLMLEFVNNLDAGTGENDIEDAVDVANAFGTISDTTLQKLMLDQVNKNYNQALANGNEKGQIIYHIEKLIMESSMQYASNTGPDLTKELGIPPVYDVTNNMLRDDKGRIILQMFFYGDDGGKGSFNVLTRLYSDRSRWKMTSTPEWVMYTSINTEVPFILFANRALDETEDLDEKAQYSLIKYMQENDYNPSITVHRGHSYFLPYTIEKMLPSSKVVVLGSCGAYHNLTDVLKISPDAAIISSKQVGYGVINIALFTYIIENLKNGNDIQWPKMKSEVASRVGAGRKEDYEDYIFPHQNLGALFIKAYKIALTKEETSSLP